MTNTSIIKQRIGATLSGTSLLAALIAGGSVPSPVTYIIVALGLIGTFAGLKLFEQGL